MRNNKENQIETLRSLVEQHKLLRLKISDVDCEGNRKSSKVFIKQKRKYVYVDYGDGYYNSGLYMIDKDNQVWGIKGYGQKGYFRGTVEQVITRYQNDIKTMERAFERKVNTGSYGMIALAY